MLYHMMGPENFLKGINSYLKTYEYGNAETAQLWESLNQFSQDNDISAIMNTWTAQVGYPVITFTKNYDTNTTQITQTRFLTIPPVVPDQTLWQVPITLANSNNFSQVDTFIFPIRTVNVEHKLGANEWYLANINRYGFYRVNYDATNWARITNALLQTPTAISASDRAGILNDAFAFSQSGLVELTFPLDLARFLVGETDYTVWSEGISGINFFGTQLRWQPSYGAFQDYFSTLVVPTAQAVGWEVNIDQDAHTTRLLRSLILNAAAVYCGDADAVANATALFQAYMKSGVAVSSDLRDVVYVVGIMYGGREEWEFLWGNYQKTNLATEQRRILRALAATPIPWLLNRLLSYALDPTKIKSQDSITAISYVASRTPGESVAWAFVRNNWDSLVEMLGGGSFSLGSLVEAVVSRFQTQQLYDEVKLFFSQKELGSAALSVEQSLESIKANIEWLAANQAKIEQFLGYSDVAAA